MLRDRVLFFFISLIRYSSILHAQIYKWTDENGQVHYSQNKPSAQHSMEIKVHVPKSINPAVNTPMPPDAYNDHITWGESCHGQSSTKANGKTYCCSSRCIQDRRSKGLVVNCLTGKCLIEERKINAKEVSDNMDNRHELARQREEERQRQRQSTSDFY